MKVNFKRLSPNAATPTKAHPSDAGFDLTATSICFEPDGTVSYGTGLAVEIPEGYAGLILPRSSICKYDLALTNSVGLIDSHYRGEIKAKFRPVLGYRRSNTAALLDEVTKPDGANIRLYKPGERIAQLLIIPYPDIQLTEAHELSDTDRSTAGYGSSGR